MADKENKDSDVKKATKTKKASAEGASDKPAKAEAKAKPKAEAKADKGEAKAEKAPKAKGAPASKRAPLAPRTYFAKNGELAETWQLVDASGQTLGRLSSHIAMLLMGKHKPNYTPFSDTGDHVVVINAEKVRLTGNKLEEKTYHYHTNYPGGIKSFTAKKIKETHPERLIEWAVWGMLPKSKGHMARHWFKKLRVYTGATHPHTAQKPVASKLPNLGIHGE